MRRFFYIPLMMLYFCMMADAQTYSLQTLRAWQHKETEGDLNKDGIKDLVIIATPAAEDTIVEDGEEMMGPQPVLAVFKGKKDGTYESWRQYDKAVPAESSPEQFIESAMAVTDRGTLKISLSYFYSAGSWSNTNYSYVYRFQNGDFYLIGEDNDSYMRNTGDGDTYSYNYLTNRKQHVKYNVFDEKVKPKESWSRIPKKTLRKLGSFVMGEGG